MNICFISNFSKTYLHAAIGRELEKHSINVYWIASNQKLYDYLVKEFGKEKVLLINRERIGKKAPVVADFKVNELIYGDRVWRHSPKDARDFLNHIQSPIYKFLKSHQIRKVFGEITWAHEILIHRICCKQKELQCQYLNPHVVRIPNGRFAFFTDERQSKMLELKKRKGFGWAKLAPKPPSYLAVNKIIWKRTSSLLGKLERIKRFVTNENIDKDDPTLLVHNKIRIRQTVKEEVNKSEYKKVQKSIFNSNSKRPFVFVGLHKQPEASVDVLGRYYEDQLQNIKNLWRALPHGWDMIVKEHAVAVGDRTVAFYKTIQELPNVYLVDEKTASYDIISRADLVATISGSIAYEAALMQVPAITFAPCFFNELNGCTQITLEHLARFNLDQISTVLSQEPSNLDAFSQRLFKNTFEGNVLDPVTDPSVLSQENIEKLLTAYLKVILLINTPKQLRNLCQK